MCCFYCFFFLLLLVMLDLSALFPFPIPCVAEERQKENVRLLLTWEGIFPYSDEEGNSFSNGGEGDKEWESLGGEMQAACCAKTVVVETLCTETVEGTRQ